MVRQYGLGIGIPKEPTFYIILYCGTTFYEIPIAWRSNCKGLKKIFRCYTFHNALNDEIAIDNGIGKSKFFIGITINK